jgi:hypothetical protein
MRIGPISSKPSTSTTTSTCSPRPLEALAGSRIGTSLLLHCDRSGAWSRNPVCWGTLWHSSGEKNNKKDMLEILGLSSQKSELGLNGLSQLEHG